MNFLNENNFDANAQLSLRESQLSMPTSFRVYERDQLDAEATPANLRLILCLPRIRTIAGSAINFARFPTASKRRGDGRGTASKEESIVYENGGECGSAACISPSRPQRLSTRSIPSLPRGRDREGERGGKGEGEERRDWRVTWFRGSARAPL